MFIIDITINRRAFRNESCLVTNVNFDPDFYEDLTPVVPKSERTSRVRQRTALSWQIMSIRASCNNNTINKKNRATFILRGWTASKYLHFSSTPGQNGRHFGWRQFQMYFLMKMIEFRFKFHWNLFSVIQLPIIWSQHWFSTEEATSHYLN